MQNGGVMEERSGFVWCGEFLVFRFDQQVKSKVIIFQQWEGV